MDLVNLVQVRLQTGVCAGGGEGPHTSQARPTPCVICGRVCLHFSLSCLVESLSLVAMAIISEYLAMVIWLSCCSSR